MIIIIIANRFSTCGLSWYNIIDVSVCVCKSVKPQTRNNSYIFRQTHSLLCLKHTYMYIILPMTLVGEEFFFWNVLCKVTSRLYYIYWGAITQLSLTSVLFGLTRYIWDDDQSVPVQGMHALNRYCSLQNNTNNTKRYSHIWCTYIYTYTACCGEQTLGSFCPGGHRKR